jgi:hypothetical protein
MGFPKIIAGPADVFTYRRNANTIAAAAQLVGGNCSSANEDPAVGIEGATRIQASTAYNLALVYFGAYDQGGLACTLPPSNYAYTTGAGEKAIKVSLTVPAFTLLVGLLVNDALAAVAATPLTVRNGTGANAEVVCYYEPSAKAITRASFVSKMTGVTTYGFDRLQFAETTGPTQLTITPQLANVQRNAGSDVGLVTGYTIQAQCSLLGSGKADMADVLNGIATKVGGLKTNPSAVFGFRGLGVPSARPIELVGPGELTGKDDSVLIYSALKLSQQAVTKNYDKSSPSTLPITFVSADDDLVKGVHGTFEYFQN